MTRFQPIYDIAEICHKKAVNDVVLCPGSRCAPLTLAFVRHPHLNTRTISDERSAAFIAIGISQQRKQPAVLVCTSGTAVYNFAPAVAEAFFNQVPLIILTADRPAEWINQNDGQTIFQNEIYKDHVKKSYILPQEYEHPDSVWAINRIVNEAINVARHDPPGPVHINLPFKEPLYPSLGEDTLYSEHIRIVDLEQPDNLLNEKTIFSLVNSLLSFHNVLLVAGQRDQNEEELQALESFSNVHKIPVVGDIASNLHPLPHAILHSDVFLGQASTSLKKTLQPDLLITFGRSLLSKNMKQFLRQHAAKEHWHIQKGGTVCDTFQHLTRIIDVDPKHFFQTLSSINRKESFESQKQQNYFKLWEVEERRATRAIQHFFPSSDLGEFELVNEVLQSLPANTNLHLANSMSVRYANFIGLKPEQHTINVYSNRGTSGIDGCTSTAVGHCFTNEALHILVTGDLAFFYDRNAFWHNYDLPNLRIVVLNNHGGIIFKMIDGPGSLPESEEFFVTKQKLNARKLCEEFNFDYLKLDNKRKLKNLLKDFFEQDGRTKILELESDSDLNKMIYNNFKQKIKESYDL